ncbi:MAG: urease accessory protein [Rhodospirillaceae bacterium]|nr:urease accessory protein [Rhodospirillaceae bacterium]
MRFIALLISLSIIPGIAQAHTGVGPASGFAHGFMHPIGGLDHLLAMVAVGLLAATMGGRALYLVPVSFVAMMAMGGIAGVTGIAFSGVEFMIGLSVVVIGLGAAFASRLPVVLAMAVAGGFALFHGYAHGAEMPQTASAAAYGLGFVLATSLLHLAGIAAGLGAGRISAAQGALAGRIGGGAIAAAGVAILAGVL